MAWCAVSSPDYNQLVDQKPAARSFEKMSVMMLYKVGIVVEYNTRPVAAGKGSAVIFHVWPGPNFTDSRLCGRGGIQYGKAAGVDGSGQVPHDNPDEKLDDFRPQTKQADKKSLVGFRMAEN